MSATQKISVGQPIDMEQRWLLGCIERGRREVFSAHVKLTPSLARLLLERNIDNRIVDKRSVERIALDIKQGRWALNGQDLIVAKCGKLNGGQHRCLAVIDTGLPVDTLIIFGIQREAQGTNDIGTRRCAGDFLSMANVKNAKICAAISRLLMGWNGGAGNFSMERITAPAAVEFSNANADSIHRSAAIAVSHHGKFRGAPPAIIGFCHHVLSEIDQEAADAFIHALCTGEMLEAGDPVLAARTRLFNATERKGRALYVEVIFRAWLSHRAGRKQSTIKTFGSVPNPRTD